MLRRHALRQIRTLSTSATQASPRAVTTTTRIARAQGQGTARRVYAFAFGVGGVTLGLVGYKLLPRTTEPAHDSILDFSPGGLISYDEIQRHNSRDSCWVVVNGEVYDVTRFLNDHPGGIAPILKVAGSDATRVFVPIHPPDTLGELPPEILHLGSVDPATMPAFSTQLTEEELRIEQARAALPHPDAAINLADIEKLAKTVLSQTAWAYYRSAGDDEFSYRENTYAFRRYWFRPRIMNKVSNVQTSTTILGIPTSLPIFVSPAALARLGHPQGEVGITRGVASEGIIQGISINASCSLQEITDARSTDFSPSASTASLSSPSQAHSSPNAPLTTTQRDHDEQDDKTQPLIFQIYLNKQRDLSESLLRKVESMGFRALMVTVDAAVGGNRELDRRAKQPEGPSSFNGPAQYGAKPSNGTKSQGVAQAISGYQDPDVCWADIAWIRSITKLPLVLKGIQCVEDAEKAYEHGVEGIVLSNHALCLGAKAVGLGRPFLYANAAWGEEGVRRTVQIMREEIETGMRLLGVTRIEDLKPEHVKYMAREPAPVQPPSAASEL
ncbi:Cytochrome b2, mitochondrial precursor [Ceratobasidium sp. 392]|nr:Cytochrome b2, mitochondrial precursor [Ceratobasidium sp. 392]